MINRRIKSKRKLIPSLHRNCLRPIANLAANIAPQIQRGKIRHRCVLEPVRVRIPSNVLPRRVFGPARGELLEDVVRSDVVYHESGNSKKARQGLHSLALNGTISRRVSEEAAARLEKNRVRQEGGRGSRQQIGGRG